MISDLIRTMHAAGAPIEAIILAVQAIEAGQAADVERRAKVAERKRKSRAAICDSHGTVTGQSQPVLPPSLSPSIPSSITTLIPETQKRASREPDGFAEWYARFPRRVARKAASKSYAAALRSGVTPAALVAGLETYIATKPPDQEWCHPTTWLNGGRWADEPPEPPLPLAPSPRGPARSPPPRQSAASSRMANVNAFRDRLNEQHRP